jgi:NADH:ubiquinone oxidoreductase subunit H
MGPTKTGGIFSIVQPLADGVKLLFKKKKNIIYTNLYLFNFLFILVLNLAIFTLLFIPISNKILLFQLPFNLIFFIIILLLSSILIIIIGFLSNNKLSILSSLRHFASLYSYSLSIIIIFFGVAYVNSSFTIIDVKVNLTT